MLQPLKQDLERQVIKYRVFRSLTTTNNASHDCR